MSIPPIDGRVTTSEVCAPFIEKFVRNFQRLYSAVPPDYLLEFLELVNSICGLPLRNIPRSGAASGGVRGDRDNVDGHTPESETDVSESGTDDVSESGTDDVSESGTDDVSESGTDNEPILTALPVDIDDQREIARRVRRICQRARASLETAILDVTVQGRKRRETLTAGQVQQAVSFFVSSIESIPRYILDVVNGVSTYNTACNAEKLSAEEERPELIRDFYQYYAGLATTEYPEPIQWITRNVHLIAFADRWRMIRETLERGGGAAAELERYFDLGGTATGKGRLSLAKSKLCKDMGLSPRRFGDYLRSAHIPTALVACFGHGAVMLVPRNPGCGRHRLPYPGAALEIFGHFQSADELSTVRSVCDMLNRLFVYPISQLEPVRLDLKHFRDTYTADTSLLRTIHLLHPRIIRAVEEASTADSGDEAEAESGRQARPGDSTDDSGPRAWRRRRRL